MTSQRFAGRVAVVSGAAHGIGKGIVLRLINEGCRVAAVDIDTDGLAELERHAAAQAAEVLPLACDVTRADALQEMLAQVDKAYGRLDFLVNNAGGSPRHALDDLSPERWSQILDLNLSSQFLCAHYALPYLRQSDRAAVVNIASLHAWRTVKGLLPYASAKGGVVAFTTALALELGPSVRVNAVAPGVIETEAWFAAVGDVEAARQHRLPFHPVGRLGTPEDIAAATAFLLSDDAAFITGVTLPVDGGLSTHLYRG